MDAEKQYYYLNAAQETLGPKTLDQLREMRDRGEVGGDTLVAAIGDPKWVRLDAALHGLAATTAQDGAAGVCPRCGTALQTENGELPASCTQCGFAVDSPHDTSNLFAHFRFTLTKKYCCFRGRATRVEYWSFALFSWLCLTAVNYIVGAVRGAILGTAQLQEELTALTENADSTEQFSALFHKFLEALGILQPAGVSTAAYATGLALLALQYAAQLALLLPTWGVTVRRMHDVGWSGWCYGVFVGLQGIFIAGAVLLLHNFFHGTLDLEALGSDALNVVAPYIFSGVALGVLWAVLGVLLFVLMLLDSKRGPNKYGPSPKYPLG